MMKKSWFIPAALVAVVFVSAAIAAVSDKTAAERKKSRSDLYNQVELFSDAVSIIRSDYVDEVDPKKLIYGAMRGMLESLDDFSQFMDADEYSEIKLETKGEFGGVGIEIGMRDGILTVIAPIAGTPAEASGIKAGDKIVRIDGKITKNLQLSEAVKGMRGKPGTTITLTIWREKEGKVFDVTLKRAMIIIHSVKISKLLQDGIGYIKLIEFQENTPSDLDIALKKLEGQGMKALILDLRNNPGGLLDTSVDVAERFLPKGAVIVSIKSRNKEEDVIFKSGGRLARLGFPLVVVVNGGSASASEIVAAAIQGNKRGVVLGTKTFGKASVQTVIPLKDGSAVRLTTAAYLTPSGKLIRGQGIAPDVVVEKEPGKPADIFDELEGKKEIKELAKKEFKNKIGLAEKNIPEEGGETAVPEDRPDPQLEAAINVIEGMMVRKDGKA